VAEILERLQQTSQVRFELARQNFSSAYEQPTSKNSALKKLRASARPEVSPTPSCVTRNRGAAARSHCADHSMTRTGPYDSISDT
jgi:hypothetical protein